MDGTKKVLTYVLDCVGASSVAFVIAGMCEFLLDDFEISLWSGLIVDCTMLMLIKRRQIMICEGKEYIKN